MQEIWKSEGRNHRQKICSGSTTNGYVHCSRQEAPTPFSRVSLASLKSVGNKPSNIGFDMLSSHQSSFTVSVMSS